MRCSVSSNPARFCPPGATSQGAHRPHPEDQGCSEGAGQPAVQENEENPVPGDTQRPPERVPGGGGGTRGLLPHLHCYKEF